MANQKYFYTILFLDDYYPERKYDSTTIDEYKKYEADKNIYWSLVDKYGSFIVTLEMMALSINYLMKIKSDADYTSINWDKFFEECKKLELHFKGLPLSELLIQLRDVLNCITIQFDKLFNEDIFV